MKKSIIKVLCLVLCLGMMASVLSACGGGDTAKSSDQTDFYIMGGMSALCGGYDADEGLNQLA